MSKLHPDNYDISKWSNKVVDSLMKNLEGKTEDEQREIINRFNRKLAGLNDSINENSLANGCPVTR